MFEKIIEKIEEEQEDTAFKMIRNDVFSLDCEYAGWVKGTNYAIEVLKEEENKFFVPENFNFISNENINRWEKLIDKTIYCLYWRGGSSSNDKKSFWEIKFKEDTPSERLFFGSILYNFEGEIILKALGVI